MDQMNRRHFSKLSAAALGGMLAGARVVLAEDKKDDKKKEAKPAEKHVCRGLNACKGQGGCGATNAKNSCAGTGECSTVAHHACAKHNACKGQGGCGANPGANACKAQGACSVPLHESAWRKARANFETAMTKAGKKFGNPPPKKK